MPGKALDYLRRLSAPHEIEDSRRFRVAAWASVSISILALALQGVASMALVTAAILLVSLGSYVSWRRRYKRNILIKVLIAALTIAALASFLRQVYLQPYDPRLPLAELFVWVLVLHSFDLPRRKDLILSLVSSLILLSLSGSFALSASFAWLVLLWLVAALPSLYFAQLSRLQDLSVSPERATLSSPSWKRLSFVLIFLLVIISCTGLAIGAVMPRLSATYLRSLPFSLRRAFNPSQGFQFDNPGYPNLPTRPPQNALEVNPESYFGFSPFLDLRTRGRLFNLPVMKVRATEPAYWSGLYFRDYNGYSWLSPEAEPRLLHAAVQPFEIQYDPDQVHLSDRRIIQTFYVEAEQPNVIFAAHRPDLVYFPSDYIYQDYTGLKSPYPLSGGLVYSVVSDAPPSGEMLDASTREAEQGVFLPYLQVPRLPDRVLSLAKEIIPGGAGPYARAQAIEDFLKREYTYSLDVPPLPQGEDALDFFLFETRSGYCEHFATAYALLCRLAGIPSRMVTGYATGEYNPFTGLYEVGLGDAHAWVEIYLEGIGWVPREPTPGFTAPNPTSGSGSLWIFGDFLSWVGNRLSSLLPGPLRSALKSGLSAIASGFAHVARHAVWLLLLLFPVAFFCIMLLLAKRRTRVRAPAGRARNGAVLAMRDFLAVLESLGLRRDPTQTAEEYAGVLYALVPGLDLSGELSLFEQARYGRRPPPEEDVRRLRKGLEEALSQVRLRLKPRRGKLPRSPRALFSLVLRR